MRAQARTKQKSLSSLDRLEAALTLADSTDAARRHLLPFVQQTHPDYIAGWVHREICARLEAFSQAVARQEAPRLLLSLPPRHGKSVIASERYPVWHLGHYPDHEIVVAGYALKPARDRVREARKVVTSEASRRVFPELSMSSDIRSKTDWRTTAGGGCYATGCTGSLTGSGATVLVIDDPHKDWAESYSALKRDAVWDWYCSTAYTRLAPGGGVLGIWTRWHEDDLAGRLLDRAGDEGWEVINYPAIAVEDERHRSAGDALHEARWPLERLAKRKSLLTTRMWEALFLGQPSSPGGSVWQRHWWRHWTAGAPTPAQAAAGW
jgi:hypothetical protein